MRLLGETKLAIDDLYDRCTKRDIHHNSETVGVEGGDEKTWAGKLRVLQFRVLDLAGMNYFYHLHLDIVEYVDKK